MNVVRGQLLATVEPTINAADATTITATIAEIEQQIATTSLRLQRLTTLASRAAAPEAQVRDLETELLALRKRLDQVRGQAAKGEEIVAPSDGVIASVGVPAGGGVEPNQVIFQIVDPGVMWVEARDFSGLSINDIRSATLGPSAAGSVALRPVAASPKLISGAGVISFEASAGSSGLKAGQLVTVIAGLHSDIKGVGVPAKAITRNASGLPVVYEHSAPEHFTMRVLTGDYVSDQTFVAQRGLNDGARIITTPAHLINQIR
ncbi:hypothetical protein GCM10019059_36420 [Camelimonas fluminis]|nr:hypothetical protein GCM10019059_36420 [Camelimonas fluminis]